MKKKYLILSLLFNFFFLNLVSAWAQTAEVFVHLGNVAGHEQKYKDAIRNYTKAIALDPDLANAFYNRGYVYIEMKKYKKAISDLDKAIELNPKYAPAYHLRGIVFFYRKMYGHAISDYNDAIQLDPDNKRYYTSRMSVYFKLGDADKAWKDVIKIQQLGGTVNPAIINLLKDKKYQDK